MSGVWVPLVIAAACAVALVAVVLARRRVVREFERYLELSPDMAILAGADGYWKRVNPAVEAILGYTADEVRAQPFLAFVHPGDRERRRDGIRRADASTFEVRMRCKDGSYKRIEWTTTPVPGQSVVYGLGRDVTERRRAEQQHAAFERVATLVAREAPGDELFGAIAEEIGLLLEAEEVGLLRFEGDGTDTALVVGRVTRLEAFAAGSHYPLEIDSVVARALRTRKPVLVEDDRGLGEPRAAAGFPFFVEGRLWGVIAASAPPGGALPPDTESCLSQFTGLVATAIANAESRAALARLAEEQAALGRVATLVAKGAGSDEVLAAVAAEVAAMFGGLAAVLKIDHETAEVVLVGALDEIGHPSGSRWPLAEALPAAEVHRTGQPSRADAALWATAKGEIGESNRRLGIVSTVATPIVVEGALWGVMTVSNSEELPLDTAQRLTKFVDLATTAIANADSRSALAASRRRIVAASDEVRRTIERNLHDGTQQRLVSLALAVHAAQTALPDDRDDLRDQLTAIAHGLVAAVDDLRELARGIHPAVLSRGGLGAALRALARRSAIPVDLDVALDTRPPEPIEAAAYFVASEALANAVKHSRAGCVRVALACRDHTLTLLISDDGIGGADPAGSGLIGLADRVEALGGAMRIKSNPAEGTLITAELPLSFL